MPSILLRRCGLLAILGNHGRSVTAQSSSTEDVGTYILQGLGYDGDTSSSTSAVAATTINNEQLKAVSSVTSRYYTNTTSASGDTAVLSTSGSSTVIIPSTSSRSDGYTSYTTFTSLCTENGTTVIHTHSAPLNSIASSSVSENSTTIETSSSIPTVIYVSTTTQVLLNSSSSSLTSSAIPAYNATSSQSSGSGIYTSSNATVPPVLSGPTASYGISSTSGYLNGTNSTGGLAGYTTASGGQQTVTTAAPWTVAQNGTGYTYASRCNVEWQSYYQTSLDVQLATYLPHITTYIITNYSAPLTTLCDGNTQIDGPLQATGTIELPWTLQSTLYSATVTLPPAPTCTVPSEQCSAIGEAGQSYNVPAGCSTLTSPGGSCTIKGSDIQVLYFPAATAANATRDVCVPSPTGALNACPYGSWVTSTTTSTQTFTGVVTIGSSTELYDYGTSTDTATNAITSPKVMTNTYTQTESECVYSKAGLGGYSNASSIVNGGVTYYADKVYLSFHSVWAEDSNGKTVGTPRAGSLIAMPSSEVYSVCTANAGQNAVSYNFEDLTGYVPKSAWNCQPYCMMVWTDVAKGGAPSQALPGDNPEDLDEWFQNPLPGDFYVNDHQVFVTAGGYCAQYPSQEWYKPWVAVPPQVRALDPEWEGCELAFAGWYDPPTALTSVTSAAGPSGPAAYSTTSAQPGSTQTSAQPSSTAAPATAPSTSAVSTQASAPSAVPYSSSVPAEATPSSSSTPVAATPTADTSDVRSSQAVAPTAYTSTEAPASSQESEASPTSGNSAEATTQAISGLISAIGPATTTSLAQAESSSDSALEGTTSNEVPSTQPSSAVAGTTDALSILTSALTSAGQYTSATPAPATLPASAESSSALPSEAAVSTDVPSTQPGDASPGTTNALSILTSAQSTAAQASPASSDSGTPAASDAGASPAPSPYVSSSALAPSVIQTTIAAGGSSLTVSQASSGAPAVVNGNTVSQGSQTTIDGQTISVGSEGVQVGSTTVSAVLADPSVVVSDPGIGDPADPSTVGATATPSTATPEIVSVGSSVYTVAQTSDAHGSTAIIVAAGTSTATLAPGETTDLGGQVLSAPSSGGVIVGSGTGATTVAPAIQSTYGYAPEASTVLSVGSSALTVAQAGSSVVFAGASSTITLAQGATTTFAGQTIAAASSDGGIFVDGSTIVLEQPAPTESLATFTGSSGVQITASQAKSSVVLAAGSSTITVVQGETTTFAGQTVIAGSSAGSIIVDSSVIPLGQPVPAATQAVVTASDGQQVTAVQTGSSIVFAAGSSTITLAQGSSTTFAGQTVAALTDGSSVVVGSSTVALSAPSLPTSGAVITGSAGQQVTVVQQGSSYAVQDGSSTLILSAGAITTLDGVGISVPKTGGAPVVNGQTLTASVLAPADPSVVTEAIATGSASQAITIQAQGSSYVVADGSSTATLAAGTTASFDGVAISVPTSGGVAVVGDSTVTLSEVTRSGSAAAQSSSSATGPRRNSETGGRVSAADPTSTATNGSGRSSWPSLTVLCGGLAGTLIAVWSI
ncbi:hypothetical protein LTR53_004500 [Teratosphaeriaceae sp. CCFEE 6253]|nr:hypothetical protein LTR53_004500 [Teratosphaeriaceae sp. CCFEE 6253]